jgi:hypothetical protein
MGMHLSFRMNYINAKQKRGMNITSIICFSRWDERCYQLIMIGQLLFNILNFFPIEYGKEFVYRPIHMLCFKSSIHI